MKVLPILLAGLILCCFACSPNKDVKIVFNDCATLVNVRVLPESEKSTTCVYFEVYQYRSEIYTLCECCVCDKYPMAVNCEGNLLCELPENCLFDFYAEADYLFTVVQD